MIIKNFFNRFTSIGDEDKYKGVIFSYFLGATWLLLLILSLQNLYLALTLNAEMAQKYIEFSYSNFAALILLGLLWWVHRRYPKFVRHVFLVQFIVGAIFLFRPEEIDRVFIALALPVIMAAFLIKPIHSFVYVILTIGTYTLKLYQEGSSILDEGYNFAGLVVLVIISVIAWLIARSLENALAETRALNHELDQRVQDRTRELAQALRREHTLAVRNKTILESIADGVLVFDAAQQVIMANAAANHLAKRSLLSLSLGDFLTTIEGKAREAIRSRMSGSKTSGGNVKFEWDERTILANIAPVILPGADDIRVGDGNVMVLRDFTREAELERAKDLFLGMVSHELRTPMTAIQGYVELLLTLEKDSLSETGYQYLHTISDSVKQLLTLANELIDVSRMETGEIALYPQWVDLTMLVNHTVKLVEQEFSKRNLILTVYIADNLPQLYVDQNRIDQVLLNLLSNAYKYTTKGGAAIEVNQTEEWVTVTVSDTGIGIKEADQEKMFERFFRASDRVVQKAGGTGLGLNISKGLIELHGGHLTFESQYGAGTTFNVTLPKNGAALTTNLKEQPQLIAQ